MANKLYAMEQLTEEVAKDVAASPQEWMRFLNTASRLYKYTFPEQLLIYAQRPEATAVASMEIWNQKMYRWIKKGSKGIALIDNTSGPKTKLRYRRVFSYIKHIFCIDGISLLNLQNL